MQRIPNRNDALLRSRRVVPLAVAAWIAIAAAGVSAQEPKAAIAAPTWYAQVLARGEAGVNVTYFWSSGSKFRAETVVAGHKIVTIVNGPSYTAYDATTLEGVAIARAPEALALDSPDRRPFGNELEVMQKMGAEKIGEESLHGVECDVYARSDAKGRRVLWVTKKEPRLPLHIEIYDAPSASTRYTDFVDWLDALKLRDEFFRPDPAVKLQNYGLAEYLEASGKGPVGPVPVLYTDLLQGPAPIR